MHRAASRPSSLWSWTRLFSSSYTTSPWSGTSKLPQIKNEPFLHYAPGSNEYQALRKAIDNLSDTVSKHVPHVGCIVNGKMVMTGDTMPQKMPHDHHRHICKFDQLNEDLVHRAIQGALEAKESWASLPQDERSAVFLKAADLLSSKYRQELNAAVMLGQGKNVWQAEVDAAVETTDFWRFGAKWAEFIHGQQPPENAPHVWNRMDYRPLEGFVACMAPFNFIAISANLPSSPVVMGNVALWKPAENATHASYLLYEILREAGLPDGVMQFLPGDGKVFANAALKSPHLAGVHFTGSTNVFNSIWKEVGDNLDQYKTYPRICGETGGKNFHVVHPTADLEHAVHSTIRGAFEYQGQKCSATSRLYVPKQVWKVMKPLLVSEASKIKLGSPLDFSIFMTAVINERAYDRIKGYIHRARTSASSHVIFGGDTDKSKGYFIHPTIVETTDPFYESLKEEIFGPVLTVYPYDDHMPFEDVLKLVNSTSKYGLTGSIFARDRNVIQSALHHLRDAAGNFYINDKCTGSIVGQQPFGGSRMSGTNDKSGSAFNLMRWVSPRSVKELFVPLRDWQYPSMKSID